MLPETKCLNDFVIGMSILSRNTMSYLCMHTMFNINCVYFENAWFDFHPSHRKCNCALKMFYLKNQSYEKKIRVTRVCVCEYECDVLFEMQTKYELPAFNL